MSGSPKQPAWKRALQVGMAILTMGQVGAPGGPVQAPESGQAKSGALRTVTQRSKFQVDEATQKRLADHVIRSSDDMGKPGEGIPDGLPDFPSEPVKPLENRNSARDDRKHEKSEDRIWERLHNGVDAGVDPPAVIDVSPGGATTADARNSPADYRWGVESLTNATRLSPSAITPGVNMHAHAQNVRMSVQNNDAAIKLALKDFEKHLRKSVSHGLNADQNRAVSAALQGVKQSAALAMQPTLGVAKSLQNDKGPAVDYKTVEKTFRDTETKIGSAFDTAYREVSKAIGPDKQRALGPGPSFKLTLSSDLHTSLAGGTVAPPSVRLGKDHGATI